VLNIQSNENNSSIKNSRSSFNKFFNLKLPVQKDLEFEDVLNKEIDPGTDYQNKIIKTEVEPTIKNFKEVEKYTNIKNISKINNKYYIEQLDQIENYSKYIFNEYRNVDNGKKTLISNFSNKGNDYFIYKWVKSNGETK